MGFENHRIVLFIMYLQSFAPPPPTLANEGPDLGIRLKLG